jgi:ABC-type multidrug transport system fused ATPase/permease subunit
MFGYVPQDPVLFSDNIYNNIVFGREFTEDDVKRAVNLAQLDGFIDRAPKGLYEMIGEKGLKLSGGEKQRVAIARAIIGRPKILLFDDATSNLDAETEKNLIERLNHESGLTMVIVSHRLSILSVCDNIYVLDKGEIKERGTHAALLRYKNLYWNLYKYQLG